jgi:hypothetical protein
VKPVDEIVAELARPGLRSCSRQPLCTARATGEKVGKSELESLLRGAGLGGPKQGRETARILACDEKTLRRWRDTACGKDLAPPDIRIILKGRQLETDRKNDEQSRFSRTG